MRARLSDSVVAFAVADPAPAIMKWTVAITLTNFVVMECFLIVGASGG
jgi:hypothetical protein